jgi:hypothetical protein
MAMTIIVEDERHARIAEIEDGGNAVLHLVMRARDADKSLRVLGYIDAYGDTTLNELQQHAALDDLADLKTLATSAQDNDIIDRFRTIIKQSLDQPHRYVKLIGD